MGIKNLLKYLKTISVNVHLSRYRGKVAGIDVYGWLHKGAYGCCVELAQGLDTDIYVQYVMEKIDMLHKYDIKPLLIFDGAPLPKKGHTHADRRNHRKQNLSKGFEQLERGDNSESWTYFRRATSVTYEMSRKLIQVLRSKNINYIVAPYEADAQLAFLSKRGFVDIVISEDSDCIPYGCKKVLYKLDAEGYGDEVSRKNLGANEQLDFSDWNDEMFLAMCILGGCDYCPSIPGVGLISAYNLVHGHRHVAKILEALSRQKKDVLPKEYEQEFFEAFLTFRHHIVYDPHSQKQCHLTDLSEDTFGIKDLDFLGQMVDESLASRLASSELHPISHQPLSFSPDTENGSKNASIYDDGGQAADTPKESDATSSSSIQTCTVAAAVAPSYYSQAFSQESSIFEENAFDWGVIQSPRRLSLEAQTELKNKKNDSPSVQRRFTKEFVQSVSGCTGSLPLKSSHASLSSSGRVLEECHSSPNFSNENTNLSIRNAKSSTTNDKMVSGRFHSDHVGENFQALTKLDATKFGDDVNVESYGKMLTRPRVSAFDENATRSTKRWKTLIIPRSEELIMNPISNEAVATMKMNTSTTSVIRNPFKKNGGTQTTSKKTKALLFPDIEDSFRQEEDIMILNDEKDQVGRVLGDSMGTKDATPILCSSQDPFEPLSNHEYRPFHEEDAIIHSSSSQECLLSSSKSQEDSPHSVSSASSNSSAVGWDKMIAAKGKRDGAIAFSPLNSTTTGKREFVPLKRV